MFSKKFLNTFFGLASVLLILMTYWQYDLGNYKSAMMQAFGLGCNTSSWLFSLLQFKIDKLRSALNE